MTEQSASDMTIPLFERLDVFDDLEPHSAAFNMALDEVLLARLDTTPLLRVYQWQRLAVSFGYFTPWKPVSSRYPERDLVRRWTGGGVVEHGEDVTYSVLIPRSHPLSNGPAGQSYLAIHHALRSALARLDWVKADLAEAADVPAAVASEACFARPVRHDLLAGGQKISGGAQRRTRVGLLHQGSVCRVGAVAADASTLAVALANTLSKQYGLPSVPGDVVSAAQRLAAIKYATSEWQCRV